jgi:hypothetical protein
LRATPSVRRRLYGGEESIGSQEGPGRAEEQVVGSAQELRRQEQALEVVSEERKGTSIVAGATSKKATGESKRGVIRAKRVVVLGSLA